MTLVVDATDLVGNLADLARTAYRSNDLPMLHGVMLHAHPGENRLYGTSTDRVMLGQAWLPCEGELPATFLRLESITVLRALLHDCPGTITLEGDGEGGLTVVDPSGGMLRIAPAQAGTFPKIEQLLRIPNGEADGATFAPELLARMIHVAKRRRYALVFTLGTKVSPSMVQIGENYRALIMPRNDPAVETFTWSVPIRPERT